jgi:hypothetical protein
LSREPVRSWAPLRVAQLPPFLSQRTQ